MKFFQRLLVAPAALGLMAPVAVNADTAFSSTTTLSGGAFLQQVQLPTAVQLIIKKSFICNMHMA